MDDIDRRIVNALQDGFPVCERPFAQAASGLGLSEDELIARVDRLLADGTLTRFGPLFDIGRLGGTFVLAAMQVPDAQFDRVAAIVTAQREVAHNYAREHAFNLWFVLAAASEADVDAAIARIEGESGLVVYAFPKQREFFVDLRLRA
jgi:DNA-binding Lrp family transcriptional regulator